MKKVGILDLGANKSPTWWQQALTSPEKKQYVAVMPQAVSVWCRQLGHRVHYANYFGVGDPRAKLPVDLDVVFIASHSNMAPLAYALSKVYGRAGTRTVLGGPHAKSYPQDALRYFDLVVLECDKALIADILDDHFDPHQIISSPKPFDDTPTIQERLPELKASIFWNGRPYAYSFIPILSSIGCPYNCNFCTDWNTSYRPLSSDRIAEDLRFASAHLPGTKLAFYDPNFGVRFDETVSIFETVPAAQRNPYAFETSLSNLRHPRRLERLRETNCLAVAPGIESWTQYNHKAGMGKSAGREKLDCVTEHFHAIQEYVPFVQTNFIFGLDTDAGDEPFELTKEFLLRNPLVYPTLHIAMAFRGTPLYDTLWKEGRILKSMPFTFYLTPYLTLILKNYDPVSYLERMVDLYSLVVSNRLLRARLAARAPCYLKFVNSYRILCYRGLLETLQRTLRQLKTDSQFLKFHLGETQILPGFYVQVYKQQLGRYFELMPIEESHPLLESQDALLPDSKSHSR
jgi:radical SAM superfamily enzyme YgiQ (UPF0313 family)